MSVRRGHICVGFMLVLAVAGILALRAGIATAAPGDLDAAFGTGGISLVSYGAGLDVATDMYIQPDGKYLLAGTHTDASAVSLPTLTRFNADGTLDGSFGVDGRVVGFGGEVVRVDPNDGAILIHDGNEITRLLSGGALDTTYGTSGVLTLASGAELVRVRSDGSMVIGSGTWTPWGGSDIDVFCLNPDGSLDTDFGASGHSTFDMAVGSTDELTCLAFAADGGILVGGQIQGEDGFLLKLNPSGSLDTQFGSGGTVLLRSTSYLSSRTVGQIGVGPGGAIFVWDKRARLFWWYFADGSPDVGWGACWNTAVPPGTVMLFNAWGVIPNGQGISPKEMEVASDGSMILVGTVDRGYPTYKDVWLARINANGTLDTGFGEAGQVITDLGGADDAAASGIDANGRLLVAAYARPTGPAGDLRNGLDAPVLRPVRAASAT